VNIKLLTHEACLFGGNDLRKVQIKICHMIHIYKIG
jgi:hypothetical protein